MIEDSTLRESGLSRNYRTLPIIQPSYFYLKKVSVSICPTK